MKRSMPSAKASLAFSIASGLGLLVSSPHPVETSNVASAPMTISEREPNDHPAEAQALGELSPGMVVTVEGMAGSQDAGAVIEELQADCGVENDQEDFYTFELGTRTNVRFQLSFRGNRNFDMRIFKTTENIDLFPEGIKLIRASTRPPGQPEDVAPMMLEAGTYYIAVDAVEDANVPRSTPYTLTLTVGNPDELHLLEDIICIASAVTENIDGALVVNQYEPTRIPATLDFITALFLKLGDKPTTAGQRLRVVIFVDPEGRDTPPSNPTLVFDEMVRLSPLGPHGLLQLFPEVDVLNGRVYVGFALPADAQTRGFSITIGRSLFGDQTFLSTDGGASWEPVNFQDPVTGMTFTAGIRTRFTLENVP